MEDRAIIPGSPRDTVASVGRSHHITGQQPMVLMEEIIVQDSADEDDNSVIVLGERTLSPKERRSFKKMKSNGMKRNGDDDDITITGTSTAQSQFKNRLVSLISSVELDSKPLKSTKLKHGYIDDSSLFIIDETGMDSSTMAEGEAKNNSITPRRKKSKIGKKRLFPKGSPISEKKKKKSRAGKSAKTWKKKLSKTLSPKNGASDEPLTPSGLSPSTLIDGAGSSKNGVADKNVVSESVIVVDSTDAESDSEANCKIISDKVGQTNGTVIVLSDSEDIGVCSGSIISDTRGKKRKKKQRSKGNMFNLGNMPSTSSVIQTNNVQKKPAESNCYLPSPIPRQNQNGLRPVIIDGSNVAFGHGKDQFSSKGIKICVEFFKKRGHEVKVFVPQYRRRHPGTRDQQILDELEKRGELIYTPSRSVQGRMVVSYDDRFVVECAFMKGGVIVSRDNFRDLLQENPEWESTINERLLMYTFCDDMIMFPQDPLGRGGPNLSSFLRY